jgi:hypothetical protein
MSGRAIEPVVVALIRHRRPRAAPSPDTILGASVHALVMITVREALTRASALQVITVSPIPLYVLSDCTSMVVNSDALFDDGRVVFAHVDGQTLLREVVSQRTTGSRDSREARSYRAVRSWFSDALSLLRSSSLRRAGGACT